VRNYVVKSYPPTQVLFNLSAKTRGIYTLGPVVIQARILAGSGAGSTFTESLQRIVVVCVAVPDKACGAAVNRTQAYWTKRWYS
jgi:hypothetical protein